MKYPNAFIVGAPKCATTAMTQYLAMHPKIGCLPKEPHRFGSDLKMRRRPMKVESYEKRTEALSRTHPIVLDASVFYLVSKTAAAEIQAYNPDAKIIIMLRKPVDMMISLHQQVMKSLTEDIEDFAEALAAEPERRQGRRIPAGALMTCGLMYREVASYADHVERYLSAFPREQIKIILFDDVVSNTRAAYESACAFLGVEPDPDVNLQPINEAGSVRNPLLVNLQRHILHRYNLYEHAKTLLPKKMRGLIWQRWQKMLYKPIVKKPIDPNLRNKITQEFIPVINRLEKLIDRDLSSWKK